MRCYAGWFQEPQVTSATYPGHFPAVAQRPASRRASFLRDYDVLEWGLKYRRYRYDSTFSYAYVRELHPETRGGM